jgi:transcriptional repressor NrdR
MRCPKCKNLETRVIDSRLSEDGLSIRRRRECEKCEARFTTFERMEFVSFFVSKSSGKKELYNRSKLETSILKACNKRNIPPEKIESMLNTLEIEWAENKTGVTSKRIGKDVLHKLKDIDEVACLRFASVYNHFESHGDFVKFILEEFEE